MINGGRDNWTICEQCLAGTPQGGKLGSFKMQFDECGRTIERVERAYRDVCTAGFRQLRCISESSMKRRYAIGRGEGEIIDFRKRAVFDRANEAGAAKRIRLDGYDLPVGSTRPLDEVFDDVAMVGAAIQKNFIVAQDFCHFRDEVTIVNRRRRSVEGPLLA